MTRGLSLIEQAISREIERMSGRMSIYAIRDQLVAKGLIPTAEELIEEYQLEKTRKAIARDRKRRIKSGALARQMVNLIEIDEEGDKTQYYKPLCELTLDEAVQHLRYWQGKVAESKHQLRLYYDFHRKQHGRKLQRRFAFMDDGDSMN